MNILFSGDQSVKWFTGDDPADRDALTGISLTRLKLVLGNFTPLSLRAKEEVGHMWENFMVAERRKNNEYSRRDVSSYFWRTEQQKEVDLIEVQDGVLSAYEFRRNFFSGIRNHEPGFSL